MESLVSDKIFSDEYKKENINQNNKTINNNLGQEYSQVLTWNLTSSKINNIDNINNQELQNNNIRHIENNTINKSVNNIYQNYSEGQQMSVNHNEVSSFKPKTVFNSPCQQVVNNDLYEDDLLEDVYIGKHQDGIIKGGFSWCTFFLGVFYVYYRKMYGFGIIWTALTIVVNNLLSSLSFLKFIINFIIDIGAACIFKEKYLEHVTKQVRKIKDKNISKSQEELLHICKKKGGTSVVPIMIYVFIISLIAFLSALPSIKIYFATKEKLKELEEERQQFNEKDLGDLYFDVPGSFTELSSSNKNDYYLLSSKNYCTLKTNKLSSTMSANEYLELYITRSYEILDNPINSKMINNNIWYYSVIQTEGNNDMEKNGIRYYYVINSANTIYQLEFIIYLDETNECSDAKDKIISSLRFN